MDIPRFYSSQRYVTDVPLRDLSFHVEVWRAPIFEETQIEALCNETVLWDTKIYSPVERIDMFRVPPKSSFTPYSRYTREIEMETLLRGSSDITPATAGGMEHLRKSLQNPSTAFFTRPSTEDFISATEKDCLVDPHQCPSRLVTTILRQHSKMHEKNNRMSFMWASGGVVDPNEISTSDTLRWKGEERVMCTITTDSKENFFVAKPSINETHTLFVDSLHVYSFKITAVPTECVEDASPTDSSADGIIRRINSLVDRVKGRLATPHAGRRDVLRQLLLEQSFVVKHKDPVTTESLWTASSFSETALKRQIQNCFIFGTVERCLGVPEDSLSLRCQWIHNVKTLGDDENDDGDSDEDGDCFSTQLAYAGVMVVEDLIPTTIHTFNAPFEHRTHRGDGAPPQFVVRAFSEGGGALRRQTPVGYALVPVPCDKPGRHWLQAQLWRVRPNGREFLRSVFVGGAPSLVDARDVAPHSTNGFLVRHGLLTEPVGTVEICVMVVVQHTAC